MAHKHLVIVSLTLIALVTVINVVVPLLLGGIVDSLANKNIDQLKKYTLYFAWILSSKYFFDVINSYCIDVFGIRFSHSLRNHLFDKTLKIKTALFDTQPAGKTLTRIINDVKTIGEVLTASMAVIILDISMIVGSLIAMFSLNWKLALTTLIPFPILLILLTTLGKKLFLAYKESRTKLSSMNSFLSENINGIITIQQLSAEKERATKFKTINYEHWIAQMKSLKSYATMQPCNNIAYGFSIFSLLVAGSYFVIEDIITTGVVVSFLAFTRNLYYPLRNLIEKLSQALSARVSYERILTHIKEPEEVLNQEFLSKKFHHQSLPIHYDHVSFAYKKNEPTLTDINFKVESDQSVAIIGRTGSGKSTLLKLLLKLYPTQSGLIRVSGQDIQHYHPHYLRRHIGLVQQNIFLFQGNMRDNLTLKQKDVSDKKLIQYCEQTHLWEHIEMLGGLDMWIAEGGHNLSLGQKQLISLTRILIFNPPILAFDEATAHLDQLTEKHVLSALDTTMKKRTCLFIAHRLSTIAHCDKVVVLEKGRVTDQGSLHEIKERNSYFALM